MKIKDKRKFDRFIIILFTIFTLAVYTTLVSPIELKQDNYSNEVFSGKVVYVKNGDTLWQLAENLNSNKDPRYLIDKIIDINNLKNNTIYVGQKLILPGN